MFSIWGKRLLTRSVWTAWKTPYICSYLSAETRTLLRDLLSKHVFLGHKTTLRLVISYARSLSKGVERKAQVGPRAHQEPAFCVAAAATAAAIAAPIAALVATAAAADCRLYSEYYPTWCWALALWCMASRSISKQEVIAVRSFVFKTAKEEYFGSFIMKKHVLAEGRRSSTRWPETCRGPEKDVSTASSASSSLRKISVKATVSTHKHTCLKVMCYTLHQWDCF